jgi:hypothetical protein
MARLRLERAFARLKIGKLDADSVRREVESWGGPSLETAMLEKLLEPSEPGERYEHAKSAVESALPTSLDSELRPFVVAAIAKRRTVRAVHAVLGRDLGGNPIAVDECFARAYKSMFAETVIPVEDPNTTGDQVLDIVARQVPTGVHARVMGCQNIKGTGLDFVYRWVSIDTVDRFLQMLESPIREKREEALRSLAMHGDYGLLDARLALQRIEASQKNDPQASTLPYDVAVARLKEVVEKRERKLVAKRSKSAGEMIRSTIGRTFDYLDATRRRRMATEMLEALITKRISHAGAAKKMREIVARAKGGWLASQAS